MSPSIQTSGTCPTTITDLARRSPRNPLLVPSDIVPSTPGMEIACLLNPGVFRFDGKIWMLLRVAERPHKVAGRISFPVLSAGGGIEILKFDESDPKLDLRDPRVIGYDGRQYLTTMSHLRLVSSDDGVHFSEPEGARPIFGQGELETFGVEDCRIAQIGSSYCLTFTEVSEHGVGVGMKLTRDWKTFESLGMVLPPHNKDCAVFEEQIGGRYFALHRPSSPELGGNYIWLASSPDLVHWGDHRCIAHSRPGRWDGARVGAGAAPIRTPRGWLEIYHGASPDHRYCLGALLLDLDEPWRVLARSQGPIMQPSAPYEQTGFLGQVIFTNGHIVDGDRLTVYYGAADTVVCSAEFSISEILGSLEAEGSRG